MGIPYLNNDESILLSTHNILVDAAVSEAILTNRRLLILDGNSPESRHKEIPFAAIETVTTTESGSGDPALSLAVLNTTGGTTPVHLVFTQQARVPRSGERDGWAQKVKEQIARMPSGTMPEYIDFSENDGEDLKKLIGYSDGGAPPGAEDRNPPASSGPKSKTALSSRFHPPAPADSGKKLLIATTAIVVVILLIACAAFVYPGFMSPKTSVPLPPATPVPTTAATPVPVITAALTQEPTPVPAVTPEQTTTVTTPQVQTDVPGDGVWVRIVYDGDYSGTIGSGGRLRELSGTGGRIYRVPATSTDIIEVAIKKLDTSGLPMTIEIFNNGEMIKRKMIITPMGTLVMTVDLKIAQTPIITPAVTQ
jgi:hypothetical protein